MVDLHGYSQEEAKERVNWHLRVAEEMNVGSFRFVTGRGNHVAPSGERGILHREFPHWLSEEDLKKIENIKKGDGYYDVEIKQPLDRRALPVPLEKMAKQWISNNIETIKSRAEAGDSFYEYLTGDCCYYGYGVEQDYKKAVNWYERASKQNNYFATYALGGCYWQGKGIRQNDVEAINLFKQADAGGLNLASHQLGDVFQYGDGVDQDLKLSFDYYKKAADLGMDIAKRKLAHLHYYGRGTPKDKRAAFSLYKEVADRGDTHCAHNVALTYLEAQTKQDSKLAFKYAKQAAEGNDPDGQYLLATFYRAGIGTQENNELSFEWLKRSANNNFKHALFEMAFHSREDAEKDLYMLKAAKAGQIIAQAFVLTIAAAPLKSLLTPSDSKAIEDDFWKQNDNEVLENILHEHFKSTVTDAYMGSNNKTKKRKKKLMRLLKALAEKNDANAMNRLGLIYSQGYGFVNPNLDVAEKYWQQGAALGNSYCWTYLGYMYEKKGKPSNNKNEYKKSFECHQKAAQKGVADSHNSLGLLYQDGMGVERDSGKAMYHFQRAIELDSGKEKFKQMQMNGIYYLPVFPHATLNLGILYYKQNKKKEGLYMMVLSALAEHEPAITFLKDMGISDQKLELLKMSIQDEKQTLSELSVDSELKQEPKTLLSLLGNLSSLLSLRCDWKITSAGIAWCYIHADEAENVKKRNIAPLRIRVTQGDKRKILFLENASPEVIEKICLNLKIETERQENLSRVALK